MAKIIHKPNGFKKSILDLNVCQKVTLMNTIFIFCEYLFVYLLFI